MKLHLFTLAVKKEQNKAAEEEEEEGIVEEETEEDDLQDKGEKKCDLSCEKGPYWNS